MDKEFTASVYLIEQEKILLIYHHKLQKWLPPGGHLEKNETPGEAAKREVVEETGYTIEFIQQENISIQQSNAKSIERPYLCLLEEIPAYGERIAHQHIDFVYIAKPLQQISSPSHTFQWFSQADLATFIPEKEIFEETLQVCFHILNQFSKENATN